LWSRNATKSGYRHAEDDQDRNIHLRRRPNSWYDRLAPEAPVVTDFQWFYGLTMIFGADAYATQYEFIVVNGHTTTSAFYKVV